MAFLYNIKQKEEILLGLNNLCEFTALEHKFKRWFCTQKSVLKVRFKDFWYKRNKSNSDLV